MPDAMFGAPALPVNGPDFTSAFAAPPVAGPEGWSGAPAAPYYGPPPPPFSYPAAAPARSNRGFLVALGILCAVVLVGCVGAVGGFYVLKGAPTAEPRPTRTPFGSAGRPGPVVSGEPVESAEPEPTGPQPSAYPAETMTDLNRVCDDEIYYPQSPKRAGKAPHPVALLLNEGDDLRRQDNGYYLDEGLSKSVERTWAPDDPKKVQLVACLDRTAVGSKVRSCKFDDPKPETVTLLRTAWRLRVYEVATGRKLLDKKMTGDDRDCPYVALVGPDKKIYTEVSDRAKVAALRGLVKK